MLKKKILLFRILNIICLCSRNHTYLNTVRGIFVLFIKYDLCVLCSIPLHMRISKRIQHIYFIAHTKFPFACLCGNINYKLLFIYVCECLHAKPKKKIHNLFHFKMFNIYAHCWRRCERVCEYNINLSHRM